MLSGIIAPKDEEKRRIALENLREASVFLLIVILILALRAYVITPAIIHGNSMEPALSDGDFIFLSRNVENIERFDIIVHRYENTSLVKRVIGIPGEYIEYQDEQLYVNDKVVPEPYLDTAMPDFALTDISYREIPEDYYFVLGDNRGASKDSREIGLIHIDDIVGRGIYRVFPFDQFGVLE